MIHQGAAPFSDFALTELLRPTVVVVIVVIAVYRRFFDYLLQYTRSYLVYYFYYKQTHSHVIVCFLCLAEIAGVNISPTRTQH